MPKLPNQSEDLTPLASPSLEQGEGDAMPVVPTHVTMTFLPSQEFGGKRTRLHAVAVYPMGLSRVALRRAFLATLFGVFALYFLLQVQAILPPFIISLFLAALADPLLRRMEKQGRSRLYGVLLLYILTTALIVLVFLLVVPRAVTQVNDLSRNFSSYYSNIQRNADLFIKENAATLKRLNIKQESVSEFVNDRSSPVRESVTKFLGGLGGLAQELFAKAFWLIIIPVATFFLMLDYPKIRAKVITTFPGEFRSHADSISETVVDVFSDYIRGLVKICSLFGFGAFLLYSGLGLDYAVFLGLLAGMFYAIPMVGQLGTSLIVATVAYSMDAHTALFFWKVPPHSVGFALLCVAGTILLGNVFFDQILYPRVVGGSVGLHPVVSMFALTVGATLYGMPGMLLAVPVAASIQIILKTAFPRLNEASKIQSESDLPPELRASH